MFGKSTAAETGGLQEATHPADQILVDSQVAFLRQQRRLAFGWIAVTSVLAIVQPFGGPETLGFMVVAFLWSLAGPLAFAIAWWRSTGFRERVMTIDLGPVILLETARILGLSMLVLYSRNELNGVFAIWGGGLDVFIGATAITFAYIVLAQRPFPRRLFVAWNLLGLIDFLVAWPLLFLFSNTAAGVFGGSGPGVEAFFRFPESFIPMFGVSFTATLHLITLMQIRGGRIPNRTPLFRPGTADNPTTVTEARHATH